MSDESHGRQLILSLIETAIGNAAQAGDTYALETLLSAWESIGCPGDKRLDKERPENATLVATGKALAIAHLSSEPGFETVGRDVLVSWAFWQGYNAK